MDLKINKREVEYLKNLINAQQTSWVGPSSEGTKLLDKLEKAAKAPRKKRQNPFEIRW